MGAVGLVCSVGDGVEAKSGLASQTESNTISMAKLPTATSIKPTNRSVTRLHKESIFLKLSQSLYLDNKTLVISSSTDWNSSIVSVIPEIKSKPRLSTDVVNKVKKFIGENHGKNSRDSTNHHGSCNCIQLSVGS